MNNKQVLALYIGITLETLLLLFPPVETSLIAVSESLDRFVADYATVGHTFVFTWPGKPIDTGRLLCIFLLILVLTGGAVIGLRSRAAVQK